MRFFSITKPGIIFGNLITVSGGYFLGVQHQVHFLNFLATLAGMSLIIASGCVFNNYIDRDIDPLMERTKNRVMVQGLISGKVANAYATLLGILGAMVLLIFTNELTVIVAIIGWVVYVLVYSLWLKRLSTLGTTLGGIAGAVPPVAGYVAATNHLDMGAVILFFILFFWQMPHFYAISIYRLKDFAAASLPVLPIKKNIRYTKISMLVYIVAFTIAAVAPTFFGYAGLIYFIVAFCIGAVWLYLGIRGFRTQNDAMWARRMFFFSIIGITILSIMMAVK